MLQPSQDKSKVLYDAVSKDYDIGTYEEFSAKLQNPEKRKSFYEGVGQEYALGTYEDFESKITPLKKKDKSDVTAQDPKLVSETSTGSLDGVGSNGFPAIDKNLGVPGLKPDLKTVEQLANPPKSNTDSTKPIKKFEGLIPDKTKGFYRQGEENVEDKKYIDEGFSNKTEYVAEEGKLVPKTKTTYVSEATKNLKANYAKEIGRKSISEYDPNLTEENLQREKEQSGVLNTLGKVGKYVLNATGESLSAWNEALGGDEGYFTIDQYEPLQDQKKQAKKDLQREGLPITEEAIQKRAEDIFRKEDRIQQIQKRVDANLPEDYDREGIWKELKLDNLKNNDKLRSAVATIDINKKQIDDFNKYAAYVNSLPKEKITQDKVDKYNKLLAEAQDSSESLEYYQKTFPKLLKEVKSSDELLDVMKFNYNDYEKAYSNITGLGKTIAMGSLKLAGETANYTDQILGREGQDTGYRQAIIDVANEELDKNTKDKEQYIRYKAKDINSFSDGGSFMAQLGTEQLPVYATLVLAPEIGLPLLGSGTAGEQFRNMEVEEMQPFAKQTTFGQKLATAYLYGSAETLFERLGTVSVLKNIEKSIARASNASRKLIYEGAAKESTKLAKRLGLNTAIEGGTEYLTAEAQIGADKYVSGKNISSQQANERRFESTVAGGLMGGSMTLMGGVWGSIAQKAKLYSENKDIKETKAILSQIDLLSDELKNNPNLNAEDKKIIYDKMNDLTNKSFDIVIKNSEKGKNFSAKENQFLVDINVKQDQLKQKFEELKNSNISTEQKELLVKDLNNQYAQLEKDRNSTLKGEFETIPDIRKIITFQKKEEDNLKDDQALINKAKPQAEVQKPSEAEALKDVESTKNALIDDIVLKNDFAGSKNQEIFFKASNLVPEEIWAESSKSPSEGIAEAYHKAKQDGSNPKLVKAVEELLGNTKETPTQQAEAEKVAEFPLLEGETLVESKQDDKGRTFNTVSTTTEKEGLKKTKFLFNRSDKPSDQRNLTSISVEKFSSDYGFEISKDAIPEGTKVTRIKEIRETDKGSTATVILENIETGDSFEGEIVITKKQPQEASPVEDVVAPSVVEGETKKINGKELTFYKLEGDNTDSGFAVEKNKDGYVIQSALLPFSKQKQGIGTDFYVRINNESIEKTGSPLKSSENLSNSGGKPFWEKLVDKGLAEKTEDGFKFKEQTKVTNETAPSQDSTIDGNIRPRISNVGESGITEQESPAKESVPSSVDVKPSESANEVNLEDIQNFINETYLNDEKSSTTTEADQGAVKNSNEENRAIPIGEKGKKQVKVTKEGKVSLQGRKALAKRQFKGDRKTASEIDPTDATSLALKYFVNGGKIVSDYFASQGERQARNNGLNGIASSKGKTIDVIAHEIWESQENSELKLDTQEIKNAVEEIVNGNLTVQDAVASILGKYNVEEQNDADYEKDYAQAIQEYQQEEKYPEEHIQEVESVLDYLSDAEIIELANSQEKSFDDYAKDLESRQVTYDLGPFSEKGTIQPDGSILSENGELLSPESVRNVKQIDTEVKSVEKQQLKEKVNAEVDKIAQKVKDLLPGINDPDLNKQGISQDDLIDLVANAVKALVSKGIDINDAIRQVVASIKERFNVDVDENLVKEKIGVEKPKSKTKKQPLEKTIKVYHGGNLDGKGRFEDGNFYVAKDKSQAEAYTKENRGKVYEYEVDENKLLEESVAREILTELGIEPRNGYDVEELGLHEILDDRFDTSITEENFNKFKSEVEKRGFVGISFTDEDITQRNKFGVENAVIFNPKVLFNTKKQRKEKLNAEVDKIADKIKDLLPGINDPDLNKQGISQDDLIDLVANAVKALVSKGIDINDAIRQVIASIKERFNVDVDENLVKEKIGVEKSIAKDELSDFRDLIRDIPQKDEVKNYLSGETIERIHGETRNDQSYNAVSLADLALHGKLVMDKAKELFGDQYVEKTLDFLESANLEADEKAIQYVALENEMDNRVSENPNDLGERKLQDLVREKSQAHLRKSAIAINAGRLRAIMKYGIDVNKYPDEILTSKQKQAKNEIEKLVQHTSEDINKEDELQEEGDGFVIAEPKAKRDKAVVKSEISDVIKKLRADLLKSAKGQSLNVSVPYAEQIAIATPHIIKLSKLFAELGGMKTREIIDAIHDELSKVFPAVKKSDVSSVLKEVYVEKSKSKDKKIQDIVKQALIDAGFSRKVKIKGEEKTLLDWKKLAGEESSIPKLKANVETSLKKQGYTNSQIKEIGKSLEDEYIRLGSDIIEKGLRELESRNKVKPTPTRKTDAKRLSELYNYGLFNGEKATEYDNLLNKTLGLSEFDVETYQKIKSLSKALASVYNQENNGRKLSEIAVQTLNSTINNQIKSLLATSALKSGTKAFNVASAFDDYVGLSMRALLGSVSTLAENKISGEFQVQLQKAFSSGKITPELKKQIEADKKAVFRDITRNAGLFYGDTNTSLTHNSRFEEWLNGKADKAMAHTVVSSFLLRAFLDGVDSSVKVRLTQKAFVKNVIKLLTSESNPNGKMSAEEAIKYVSEQLTGENFKKALETAKSIIEDVNKEQGKKVIKDTDEAIHRFAMDLVKENLLSSDMLTMDNIESAYKSAYKSAGRSIGHEANNIISAGVNLLSSTLNKRLEKAIQEKNYALATSLTLLSTIQKSIINPFVGGGTNWVILGLEKSGNPLGYISVIHNATERRKLDLSENKTDITQSLYRESIYQDSAMRLLVGTGMAMAMFAALTAGDDEEELLGKLNQWLKDNPWAKKHFNKLSPEAVTFLLDRENNELSKHWQKVLGMKNDYFDNTKTLIKTFSDENSSMSGAFGAFLGQNLSSPGPWKTIKDVVDILRGIKGVPPVKTDYKTNGFWNGYFRAGLIDFMKLRPGVNYDLNSKIDKVKDDAKKLNSEIDSFVKEIYDKKLSDSEINKKINELFDKEPLKKEKILNAVKNRSEEEKLKRSGVDPFYIKLKREPNDEIKAILFQDRFNDVSKLSPAERDEIVKGMNAIKFTGGTEFWYAYWRLSKPEMFKNNKPVN